MAQPASQPILSCYLVFVLTVTCSASLAAGEKPAVPLSPPSLQDPAPPPAQLPAPMPSEPPRVLPTIPPVPPPFPMPYMPPTFAFKFGPDTTLKDLLPSAPHVRLELPALLNDDLSKVPEVYFGEGISKELPKHQAIEKTAYLVARINHLNRKKTDAFMEALIDNRADLRGLAFRMGDECRTPAAQAKLLSEVSEIVQTELRPLRDPSQLEQPLVDAFWKRLHDRFVSVGSPEAKARIARCGQAAVDRALVAGLMQILAPESENCRVGLARFLSTINHLDAIHALAKLAIFAPEDAVRAAAIDGLRLRRERDYTAILMEGFRYPLPAVSKRAAEALIKLERKDLLADLVNVLEQPDPRAPAQTVINGQEVMVVRELVRVNHHKNCLMCHAPGNTGNVPEGVLKVAVPLPGETLQRPSDAYYQTPPASPDIVVRIDTTYLRQDFARMMPVEDAHPWPTSQRFDFMVRTRVLTALESAMCEQQLAPRVAGQLPPTHRAALFALRELTGRDTEPTAEAWRNLLSAKATIVSEPRP